MFLAWQQNQRWGFQVVFEEMVQNVNSGKQISEGLPKISLNYICQILKYSISKFLIRATRTLALKADSHSSLTKGSYPVTRTGSMGSTEGRQGDPRVQ